MSFADALELTEGVEGWLTDAQARTLWDAARAGPPAERSSRSGRSAGARRSCSRWRSASAAGWWRSIPTAAATGGHRRSRPTRCGGIADHASFHANLERAGVAARVTLVRRAIGRGAGAVHGAVDLLYVDGAHRYGPALADIEQWGARVRPGGSMLIHDSFSAIGVTRAQARSLFYCRRLALPGPGGLARPLHTRAARARPVAWPNAARQAVGLGYFARNLAVKLLITLRLARLLGRRSANWPY